MSTKDIRNKFPLGKYHDLALIRVYTGGGYKGRVYFKVPITGDEICIYTSTFCHHIGMSEEDTVFWILKYGIKLPQHIDEIKH